MLLSTLSELLPAYLILEKGGQPIYWIFVAIFGLGFLLGLYLIFNRKPQIVLNEAGILDKSMSSTRINWESIKGVHKVTVYRLTIIRLVIDEQLAPIYKKGKADGTTGRLYGSGLIGLDLNTEHTNANPDKLLSKIEMLINSKGTERVKMLNIGL